ncbi:MAG TPA: type II secretion system F family protein [Burkholderiales bacterium]|nr:type II secretion system F family protein [Burkholderiales bacterium]
MPLFNYKAVTSAGKVTTGLLDAANPVDLELRLKRMGLDLITGKPAGERASVGGGVPRRELITFFFNLEQLSRSGVPLLECLSDLRDTVLDPRFRQVLASMIESIEGGKRLSQAMGEHPVTFDRVFVALVRAGEESGRLPEVFRHLTETLKWQDEMASQTKQILMYPAFVLVVVGALVFFLMIYLVPQLVVFIKAMGQELPLQTRILMFTSQVFVHYWHLILFLPIAALVGILVAARTSPAVRYRFDGIKLRMWPVGPILQKIILARFANSFAMMYSSGIKVLDCLGILRDIVGNAVVADSLDKARHEIEEGKNLTQSFANTGMFPPLVLRMLRVGEATGGLDTALLNVAYFYERDVKESIKRVQTMIEPTLTLVMGGILGWIMFSVLMPIYDLITKLKI